MNVSSVPEHRWLLPAALAAPRADGRWVPRTTRDWATDAFCFLVAALWCLVAIGEQLEPGTSSWINAPASDAVLLADMAVGFLAAGALWGRRRWPVGVALALVVMGSFSVGSAVAQLIALFTVAVHRRLAVATVMSVLCLGSSAIFCLLRPDPTSSYGVDMAVSVAVILVVQLWGMVVRVRRQLVLSLRDRVHRAESEEQLRVAQARTLERTRIAREMHDVLAHRISLLSLHAGALEVRPDASPAEIGRAAAVIRASAHQALQDLREVIGVLRDQPGDPAPGRPQPTLDDLPTLVEESRQAGVRVHLDLRVDEPRAVPDGIGRAAYRIVQEGLTNARKHAPGAAVSVTVGGAAGAGLSIAVRNPFPAGRSPDGSSPSVIPGTGTGLIGLAERATLVGGLLAPERTPDRRVRPHRVVAVADVTPTGEPVRVLIVDDDPLVRAGLTMILSGMDDVRVVGEAADGSEVPAAVAAHRPDVVLMDIRMPRVDGLTALEALRRRLPAPEVIVLTTFDADEYVLRALRAGASGFLLKDTPPLDIRNAVRRVALGEAALSPTVTRRLIAQVAGATRPASSRAEALLLLDGLSEREREVALALGQGLSNAEIAGELFMSVATVKAHVSRLFVKLTLTNRVQVALLVHDAGLG